MSKIGAIAQSDTSIITDGLVFNMDFSKFACYPRSGTTCTDLNTSIDGTFTNGASFTSDNLGAFVGDGVDDHIACGNNAIFQSFPLTIEAWVFNDAEKDRNAILTKGRSSGNAGDRNLDIIWIDTTRTNMDFIVSNGSSFVVQLQVAKPSAGAWHHIVAQWDGTTNSNTAKLFTDNALAGQTTATGTGFATNHDVFIGGQHPSNANRTWDGKIAVIRTYNRVLTTDEISINYNALKERFGL
jgi:hypothetical protein